MKSNQLPHQPIESPINAASCRRLSPSIFKTSNSLKASAKLVPFQACHNKKKAEGGKFSAILMAFSQVCKCGMYECMLTKANGLV